MSKFAGSSRLIQPAFGRFGIESLERRTCLSTTVQSAAFSSAGIVEMPTFVRAVPVEPSGDHRAFATRLADDPWRAPSRTDESPEAYGHRNHYALFGWRSLGILHWNLVVQAPPQVVFPPAQPVHVAPPALELPQAGTPDDRNLAQPSNPPAKSPRVDDRVKGVVDRTPPSQPTPDESSAGIRPAQSILDQPAVATNPAPTAAAVRTRALEGGSLSAEVFAAADEPATASVGTRAADLGFDNRAPSGTSVRSGAIYFSIRHVAQMAGDAVVGVLTPEVQAAAAAVASKAEIAAGAATAAVSARDFFIPPLGSSYAFLHDSLASMTDEFASIPLASSIADSVGRPHRAWWITGAVVAADVLLLAALYQKRVQRKHSRAAAAYA